jgi:hypothetical protein
MALQLEEDKGLILRLVQLKMDRIAPNLSAAVGTEIAAQLMGVAGGLVNLSKMPACNVQVGDVGACCCVGASVLRRAGVLVGVAEVAVQDGLRGNLAPTACLPAGLPVSAAVSALWLFAPGAACAQPVNLSLPPGLQVLGAKRKTLAGFSSTAAQPHQGFIFASDIVQQTPPGLRTKAARLVGAKCTLLARIDAYGQVRAGGAIA